MSSSFIQPNCYSCVPTSFAYLVYKQLGDDFQSVLRRVLDLCEERFDLKENGMEFDQLQQVAQELGYETHLSPAKQYSEKYLVGVATLPKTIHYDPGTMEEAIREGSLKLSANEYVFPFGHAIVVMETKEGIRIFDSFAGTEYSLPKDVLLKSLESETTYFSLK